MGSANQWQPESLGRTIQTVKKLDEMVDISMQLAAHKSRDDIPEQTSSHIDYIVADVRANIHWVTDALKDKSNNVQQRAAIVESCCQTMQGALQLAKQLQNDVIRRNDDINDCFLPRNRRPVDLTAPLQTIHNHFQEFEQMLDESIVSLNTMRQEQSKKRWDKSKEIIAHLQTYFMSDQQTIEEVISQELQTLESTLGYNTKEIAGLIDVVKGEVVSELQAVADTVQDQLAIRLSQDVCRMEQQVQNIEQMAAFHITDYVQNATMAIKKRLPKTVERDFIYILDTSVNSLHEDFHGQIETLAQAMVDDIGRFCSLLYKASQEEETNIWQEFNELGQKICGDLSSIPWYQFDSAIVSDCLLRCAEKLNDLLIEELSDIQLAQLVAKNEVREQCNDILILLDAIAKTEYANLSVELTCKQDDLCAKIVTESNALVTSANNGASTLEQNCLFEANVLVESLSQAKIIIEAHIDDFFQSVQAAVGCVVNQCATELTADIDNNAVAVQTDLEAQACQLATQAAVLCDKILALQKTVVAALSDHLNRAIDSEERILDQLYLTFHNLDARIADMLFALISVFDGISELLKWGITASEKTGLILSIIDELDMGGGGGGGG